MTGAAVLTKINATHFAGGIGNRQRLRGRESREVTPIVAAGNFDARDVVVAGNARVIFQMQCRDFARRFGINHENQRRAVAFA